MSTNQMIHKIEILHEWEKIADETKAEAEVLWDEIKQELLSHGTDELTPEGDGFVYLDSGHNRFYTEHIIGNLYYYSASF